MDENFVHPYIGTKSRGIRLLGRSLYNRPRDKLSWFKIRWRLYKIDRRATMVNIGHMFIRVIPNIGVGQAIKTKKLTPQLKWPL